MTHCTDIPYSFLPKITRFHKKLNKTEQDFRSGSETYGHSEEEFFSRMMYISDRYMCAWRLPWLIDSLNLRKETNDI